MSLKGPLPAYALETIKAALRPKVALLPSACVKRIGPIKPAAATEPTILDVTCLTRLSAPLSPFPSIVIAELARVQVRLQLQMTVSR